SAWHAMRIRSMSNMRWEHWDDSTPTKRGRCWQKSWHGQIWPTTQAARLAATRLRRLDYRAIRPTSPRFCRTCSTPAIVKAKLLHWRWDDLEVARPCQTFEP